MMRYIAVIFTCFVLSCFFVYINADLNLQENNIYESRNLEQNINAFSFEDKNDLPQRADCRCDNGKCVKENGKDVCKCNLGYGNYTRSYCKACRCGPNKGCIFIYRNFLNTEKVCICNPGYFEDKGKCVASPCSSNPCKNGGNCTNSGKKFSCKCVKPYQGETCERSPCTSKPCKNGGKCDVYGQGFKCNCVGPWKGKTCDKDPCSSNPCQNGGTCSVDKQGIKCSCKSPFKGSFCEIGPCSSNPCQNGGNCSVSAQTYKCGCKSPFKGKNCEIGPCSSNPCKNGGTCNVDGQNFNCSCKTPFTGEMCETGPCSANPCQNGGKCTVIGQMYKCDCRKPYKGKNCEKSPCASNPCQNNGKCKVDNENFKCECKEPYKGNLCQNGTCSSNPCQNKGVCEEVGLSFKCKCKEPFKGKNCEIGPCSSNPCQNRGTCKVVGTNIQCDCKPPYEGNQCEKDPCTTRPCLNKGNCTVKGNSFKCSCQEPFFGKRCEKDMCSSSPCQNGGTCKIKGNAYSCDCPKDYVGERCQYGCDCKNGKCRVSSDGDVICECLPEYGKKSEVCEACDCGTGANCTWEGGFWGYLKTKYCLCPDGSRLKEKQCEEFYTTPTEPTFSSTKITVPPSSTTKLFSTTSLLKSTINVSTDIATSNFTDEINMTTYDPSNFTYDFNRTTSEPSNFTQNFNKTTFRPSNFTNDFNWTTSQPSNFTQDFNWTTFKPSNFTQDFNFTTFKQTSYTQSFNWTTYEPSNFTQDFNKTTFSPSNFTNDFNWTTYEPSNFTQDFNWTTFQPSNFTNDLNWTTHEPSNFTFGFKETTYEPSNFTSDINITTYTTYEPANFTYDYNLTTYEPSNFTDVVNMTSYEPSNITKENHTSETTQFVSMTSTLSTTTTTRITGVCDYNPCQNGGTCRLDKGIAKCVCPSQYTGENCTDTLWCTKGAGRELCRGGGCTFDFQTNIGRCTCPDNEYYNYERKHCEVVDLCPFMAKKCNEENNEVCKNGDCQCKENFIKNKTNKCMPNFCALNPCGENEDCIDIENDPGYVKCKCKKGYIFNGEYCKKGNACSIPGKMNCQQLCNIDTESCDCYSGFNLQSDKKTCVRKNSTKLCSMECGVGTCVEMNGNYSCLCPPSHVFNGGTCIDLCSANQIPEGLCPSNTCIVDKELVFKCRCDGKFTYDETGFTCRKKLMCTEGGGKQACKKRNSICVEDFDHPDGFTCKCEKGLGEDTDGTCKKKCDMSSQKDECSRKGAVCDMDGFDAICRCPPLLTFGPDGRCSDFVKASYSGEIFLALERYSSKKLFYPASQFATFDASINIDLIRQDLRESMHALYGKKYQFADVLNCRIENEKLKCLIELQFQSDPQDQVEMIVDSHFCVNVDKNTCFIPPKLLIDKQSLKSGTFVATDPCSKIISKDYCGRDTECKRKKGFSFECICMEGLESYSSYKPISDSNTIIHQCQDIDECKQITACPNTTTCYNVYRSYKCFCLKGYKPPAESSDLRQSGCIDVCNPNPCKHGKCEIVGDVYGCKCDAGYTGFDCNEVILNTAEKEGMKVALIILSVLVVPLILLSVFMVYQYRLLKKRTFKSSYFDDQSSTINLQPMRKETDE